MAENWILVTGGSGYVGSHTIVELYKAGYKAVVIDNLVNSETESIKRVRKLVGHDFPFYSVDLLDVESLVEVFKKHKFQCVIHIAGLKAVGESVQKPLEYYKNNVGGTINLLEVMKQFNLYSMIFSSSATVYGFPQYLPIDEKHPAGSCTNPYGKTKWFIENILQDLCHSSDIWKVIILRYFNPIGAHESGTIGEDPSGIPNNLMPYIAQVGVGKNPCLSVFGQDYDTPDGTGVRDYLHIIDLADGHVKALKALKNECQTFNLGTGQGYSVLQMIKAFEKASGKTVNYKICSRRYGDVDTMYADASLAKKVLGWEAKRGLPEMCEDLWRWQVNNPQGYRTEQKM
ncbi:DgyrCDS7712 [Dimorphilus gyrociliatus]|uniref:UDP-glucose 4-epimerase n=1 Tax=Dimorphilus gyrociliatus TaxID=2664684 RepID=A0A7I8VU37_9ANNE|nr:DgyrCDS7712 [Dimorphilus gyrociliatus]